MAAWHLLLEPGEAVVAGVSGFQDEREIKRMQPHEERVVDEKVQLDEKLAKLKAFCFERRSPIFDKLPPEDRDLLEDQYTVMLRYSEILARRIERFK